MSKQRLLFTSLLLLLAGVGAFYFFWPSKLHYAKVELYYNPSIKIPSFDIEIEKKKYHVELDTGSDQHLSLFSQALNQIEIKRSLGTQTLFDIFNRSYTVPVFEIPKIKISNFTAFPIELLQEDEVFMRRGGYIGNLNPEKVDKELESIDGRIGIRLFENFCLLIDLPHSIMYIAKDITDLESKLALQEFTEVPLAVSRWAILLVETEFGTKRLLLDTGAAFSTWHSEDTPELQTFTLHHLRLGNTDFGPHKFATFHLPEALHADGILGIDFLEKHPILIDFKHQRALIRD